MLVLIEKPEVDRIDAALLVEELVEIYSTPTSKGWREAKKVIILIRFVPYYNGQGFIFVSWANDS